KTLQQGEGIFDSATFYSRSMKTEKYSFRGINANIGFLWEISNALRLGAVLKTPFDADLEFSRSYSSEIYFSDTSAPSGEPQTEKENQTLEMPMSYGIGLAYRVSPKLLISADIYRTQWDDFVLEDAEGNRKSPLTNEEIGSSDIDATVQVRMGAEYLITTENFIIPLCAGIFYDPAPAPGSPDDFYGFSLGSGLGYGQFHMDLAYQYRFGNDTSAYMLENRGFSTDVSEHTVYTSVVLHF
ncbi:MAG: hypothetical protein V2I97_08215, partial [Desulfococcaceae bacterium]|nr:hypothetical protein [Desulfococcaceae bacterium]